MQQAIADRRLVDQAGARGGLAADFHTLGLLGMQCLKHFGRQEAVTEEEKQVRPAARCGGERIALLSQPARKAMEQGAEHIMAEREGGIAFVAQ